jgi:hypothetical protein
MEVNEISDASSEIMPEPARPQFLTVLCILTWICSGFMFLSTLYNTFNNPTPEEMANQVEKMRQISEQMAERMELAFENQDHTTMLISNLISLVSLLITTLGTAMMWQLKKKGFYIYILGELLPYIGFALAGSAAFEAMSSASGMSAGAMMGMAIVFMALFDGIFVAMYAANLKHMKN